MNLSKLQESGGQRSLAGNGPWGCKELYVYDVATESNNKNNF